MFPEGLEQAIASKKAFHGSLDLPQTAFPSWDDIVPYFDRSFLSGNKRARDPHKIFIDVKTNDFAIVKTIKSELGKLLTGDLPNSSYWKRVLDSVDISCHCYAGFSPNAIASPPHKDPMEVFFVMIKGTMPWKIFENGCDYNDVDQTMSSKSTFSKRLTPGDFVYVPKGVYHVALPDCSRVGFSFGW